MFLSAAESEPDIPPEMHVPSRESNSCPLKQSAMETDMDPPGFFPLIVRGGRGVTATHDGGTLTVQFRKARVAAGTPETYGRMPIGSAAWVDRPLNDAEPPTLKQQMNEQDAANIIAVLRNESRFWKFLCSNTNTGHFAVHRSEAAFMVVKID